jgi:hypothetical protein
MTYKHKVFALPSREDAKKIILDAIENGKLQAQQPEWIEKKMHTDYGVASITCLYAGPCAVGVLLDSETAARADETVDTLGDAGVKSLIDEGFFTVVDETDKRWYTIVQSYHDSGNIEELKRFLETGEQ